MTYKEILWDAIQIKGFEKYENMLFEDRKEKLKQFRVTFTKSHQYTF